MPKKKLFNGKHYVGAYVDDETYRVLQMHSKNKKKSIADILRAVLSKYTELLNYPKIKDETKVDDGAIE